ncbi:LCP family protein [Streptomyces sp. NPDC093097]|uniref:LCP family protein n=1 Tax=Streptomyces sp. NPDC093097 TaxID=3366027 RepID=UPI0037FD4643
MTAPSPSSRTVPGRRPRRRRARWGLRVSTAAAALLLSASGVGHAMVTGVEAGIGRVDAFQGMTDRPGGGAGLTFLVAGTDSRDKLTDEEKQKYHLGGDPCHCTDTLMLVHLAADRSHASVVSLPRDSYAEVPAYPDAEGRRHPEHAIKLNAAYAEGGANLTVRTVEHMTGVHIDHYLEVDFTSFMRTVDAVGGVDLCTVRPLKDRYSGLDLPAGTSRLGGGRALQYVRARHVDASADLGRMQRQQRFLAALLHRITSSGVLMNPVRFKEVADAVLQSVRADADFNAGDLTDLAQAMRGFGPASSEFASVPLRGPAEEVPGLGSTVRWDPVRAPRLFRALREDRPFALHRDRTRPPAAVVDVPPERVRVRVDNGAGRRGLATEVTRQLHAAGFATADAPGDSALGTVPHTVVSYDPHWDRSARTVAAALPGAQLRPAAGQGPVMRVTVGTDFRAVRPVRAEEPTPAPGSVAAMTGDQAVCR